MVSLASPTGSLIEAETVPITLNNLGALMSQITLHDQGSVDQDITDSISPGQQNSDKQTEDEQAKDEEEEDYYDDDDNMSDSSMSSGSTTSSPIWTPLEVFDFSKHDQVIADITAHLQNYEAMALDLGWEYSYAAAVLEQEDMREEGIDQYDGVINFEYEDDDDSMAMLVAREVRYWQAQLHHGMSLSSLYLCLIFLSSADEVLCFDLIA